MPLAPDGTCPQFAFCSKAAQTPMPRQEGGWTALHAAAQNGDRETSNCCWPMAQMPRARRQQSDRARSCSDQRSSRTRDLTGCLGSFPLTGPHAGRATRRTSPRHAGGLCLRRIAGRSGRAARPGTRAQRTLWRKLARNLAHLRPGGTRSSGQDLECGEARPGDRIRG